MNQNRAKMEKTVSDFFLGSIWQVQKREWSEEDDLLILTVSASQKISFPFFTIFIAREKISNQPDHRTNLAVSVRKELDRQLGDKLEISGAEMDFPLLLEKTSAWMND